MKINVTTFSCSVFYDLNSGSYTAYLEALVKVGTNTYKVERRVSITPDGKIVPQRTDYPAVRKVPSYDPAPAKTGEAIQAWAIQVTDNFLDSPQAPQAIRAAKQAKLVERYHAVTRSRFQMMEQVRGLAAEMRHLVAEIDPETDLTLSSTREFQPTPVELLEDDSNNDLWYGGVVATSDYYKNRAFRGEGQLFSVADQFRNRWLYLRPVKKGTS